MRTRERGARGPRSRRRGDRRRRARVHPALLTAWEGGGGGRARRGRGRPPSDRRRRAPTSLRAGGNAVDAALAALLTSFMTEPLLTGLGAGGYMLVAPPGGEPVLLDFMVEAPGRDADPDARAPLDAVVIDFGDAVQVFHIGASSCGVYGVPAGVAAAAARFGSDAAGASWPRPRSRWPATASWSTASRRYLWEMLEPIAAATPESRARYCPDGRVPREGDVLRDPELADAHRAARPPRARRRSTRGDIGAAVSDWVMRARRHADPRGPRRATRRSPREPVRVRYHGREVLTNPPPSAGGDADRLRARAARARRPAPPGARGSSSRRWRPRRPSARRRSSTGLARARVPRDVHGLAARLDDARLACWTPTAGRARSRPPTARARGSSSPAPASTSTT